MFNYSGFTDDIVVQFEAAARKVCSENKDIYICSLDCCSDTDSIGLIANTKSWLADMIAKRDASCGRFKPSDYYYKYCEEEWDIFLTFEDISLNMSNYCYSKENGGVYSDSGTGLQDDEFDDHRQRIIAACKKALRRIKKTAFFQENPQLLLTLNVREFLKGNERAEIFTELNGSDAVREYVAHIEDFN